MQILITLAVLYLLGATCFAAMLLCLDVTLKDKHDWRQYITGVVCWPYTLYFLLKP